MDYKFFFDFEGKPILVLKDSVFFSIDGNPVLFIHQNAIFDFNRNQRGWYYNNWVVSDSGDYTLFCMDSISGLTKPPLRAYPATPIFRSVPVIPSVGTPRPMGSVNYKWCKTFKV